MLEKDIEKKMRDLCKKKGVYTKKFVSTSNAGVPDRILVGKGGVVVFMELKRPGNTPTGLQYDNLNQLRVLGANALWTDDWSLIESIVEALSVKGILPSECNGAPYKI